jgi:hypothetical protein
LFKNKAYDESVNNHWPFLNMTTSPRKPLLPRILKTVQLGTFFFLVWTT